MMIETAHPANPYPQIVITMSLVEAAQLLAVIGNLSHTGLLRSIRECGGETVMFFDRFESIRDEALNNPIDIYRFYDSLIEKMNLSAINEHK